jgi:Flp pilus assembly protein protease CpaA
MAAPFDPRSPDWPAQAADRVVSVVDTIRDKTTVPLTTVARGLVYGLVAGVMGAAALILLAIAGVRAVDVALPGGVWLAHLVIGMFFTLAGLFLWSKRRRKD